MLTRRILCRVSGLVTYSFSYSFADAFFLNRSFFSWSFHFRKRVIKMEKNLHSFSFLPSFSLFLGNLISSFILAFLHSSHHFPTVDSIFRFFPFPIFPHIFFSFRFIHSFPFYSSTPYAHFLSHFSHFSIYLPHLLFYSFCRCRNGRPGGRRGMRAPTCRRRCSRGTSAWCRWRS